MRPLRAAVPMVVAVTMNPAIDRTIWHTGPDAGEICRIVAERRQAGGEGVNVSAAAAGTGVVERKRRDSLLPAVSLSRLA